MSKLVGELEVPGDKSISHRAVLLTTLASGKCAVQNFVRSEDCLASLDCAQQLGLTAEWEGDTLILEGPGKMSEPSRVLEAHNSGTTMRLLSGIQAGHPGFTVIDGDASLRGRPMDRIIDPLSQMGARMYGRQGNRFAPLAIVGDRLSPIDYKTPVASAQVKSAILLAGCQTEGTTRVTEATASRNHTELMLESMGASLRRNGTRTEVDGPSDLSAVDVIVPGDFSSAAFFLTAALLLPGSDLVIRNVGINPTRTGFLRAVEAMGASIHLDNRRESAGEAIADLGIEPAELRAIVVDGEQVPAILDELPLLAVVASQARGCTLVTGAAELRVKETDRIAAVTSELTKLGVSIESFTDGFAIEGPSNIQGATVNSHGDHRIAMSLRIASLLTDDPVEIVNYESVAVSFPDFEERLQLVMDKQS